jgi:hypothetical protein
MQIMCWLVLVQFLDQYVRLASGPLKWVKLVEFLKTTYPRIVNEMLARQEAQVRTDLITLILPVSVQLV